MATILIVPGLRDSGPTHWQTWWHHRDPSAYRVEQDDWHATDLERWSARVTEALDRADGPVWLVAHSFGCLASIRAAADRPGRIAGALLVAPADPARFGLETRLTKEPLAFPSIMVASTNDPWMPFQRILLWSERWASRWVSLGRAGHINSESGFGPWPEGQALLQELRGC